MDKEKIEILLKIVTIFSVCYVIYEKTFESRNRTGKKIREDYKFAKDFFEDRKNSSLDKYLIELGYLGITQDQSIKTEEAEYLLSLQKPVIALFWFKKTRRYLTFSMTNIDRKITFKQKYKEENFREEHKLKYLSLYYIMFLLASFRLLFPTLPFLTNNHYLILWILFWLLLAWESLKAYLDMEMAEDLVRLQSGDLSVKKKISLREFIKKTFGLINRKTYLFMRQKDNRS
jgi:hypothetical protein